MLTIDPFKPAPRHRKRATARRYVTGTLLAITAVIVAALLFQAITAVSGDAPDLFGGTVAHDATRAVAGFTPSPAPLGHGLVSRAVTRHYRAR